MPYVIDNIRCSRRHEHPIFSTEVTVSFFNFSGDATSNQSETGCQRGSDLC